MYSILIVDDEKNVTESLKESIPWPNLGVDHVYTAENGEQAIGIMANIHIDLVIADIQMPHMDGLQLVSEIRMYYPGLHCIFLTAYDRFEYALQALKLGVDNYILKPISMIEVTQTIENTLDNLYAERENRTTIFQENIIRRWLNGDIGSNDLTEKASFLPVSVYLHNYIVVAIKTLRDDETFKIFMDACREGIAHTCNVAVLHDNYERYVLLVGGKQISQEYIQGILEQKTNEYKVNGQIVCVVSQVVIDCMKVHMCYQNVTEYLNKMQPAVGIKEVHMLLTDMPPAGLDIQCDGQLLSPITLRAKDYLEKHYSEGISLKTVSSHLNVNTAYLGYLFKKETGVYFNTYLNEYRVERAEELLRKSAYSVSEIAAVVGFATSSHFITTFKKKYGVPPMKYKMLHYEED